jgi:hypothetical protein
MPQPKRNLTSIDPVTARVRMVPVFLDELQSTRHNFRSVSMLYNETMVNRQADAVSRVISTG